MYSFIKHKNGPTVWTDDKCVYEKRKDAEIQIEKAKIMAEMIEHEAYAKKEQEFRLKIGLTNLEGDANVLRAALFKAQIELAFAVEMDKNNFVIKKLKLKASNTRKMYNDVRKKIFKICLTHGVESEHRIDRS